MKGKTVADIIEPPKKIIQWDRLLLKYGSPTIPNDVRADFADLVGFSHQLAAESQKLIAENKVLRAELQGAFTTLQALSKAVGEISLPHALIASLDGNDHMHVSDIDTPNGYIKLFRFEAGKKTEE